MSGYSSPLPPGVDPARGMPAGSERTPAIAGDSAAVLDYMLERHVIEKWAQKKREFEKDLLLDELIRRRGGGRFTDLDAVLDGRPGMYVNQQAQQGGGQGQLHPHAQHHHHHHHHHTAQMMTAMPPGMFHPAAGVTHMMNPGAAHGAGDATASGGPGQAGGGYGMYPPTGYGMYPTPPGWGAYPHMQAPYGMAPYGYYPPGHGQGQYHLGTFPPPEAVVESDGVEAPVAAAPHAQVPGNNSFGREQESAFGQRDPAVPGLQPGFDLRGKPVSASPTSPRSRMRRGSPSSSHGGGGNPPADGLRGRRRSSMRARDEEPTKWSAKEELTRAKLDLGYTDDEGSTDESASEEKCEPELLSADEIRVATADTLVKELFKRYDTDVDGELNKKDYNQLMRHILHSVTEKDRYCGTVTAKSLLERSDTERVEVYRALLLAPPIGSIVTVDGHPNHKVNGKRGRVRKVLLDGAIEISLVGGDKVKCEYDQLIWEHGAT